MSNRSQPNFVFAVVADPHCSEHQDTQPLSGLERFISCTAAMRELPPAEKPAFMLLLGDVHIDAFAEVLPSVKIPIHAIAGNHEADRDKKEALQALFPDDFQVDGQPSDYYAFVHQGVRFVGICNAGCGGEHIGQLCSQTIQPRGQCEWLERQLRADEPHKVVFAHVPPHPEGADEEMYMSRNDSRWFNALIRETRPTAMFFGHLHEDSREVRIGTTPGFMLRSCAWNFQEARCGFTLARITPAGIETREVMID